jgi:hypothetical protein
MVKSGVRVAGVILALVLRDWWVLAIFLGIAEIIGVFEEVVDG